MKLKNFLLAMVYVPTLQGVTTAPVLCKGYSVPAGDGCNTCHGRKCTDGKTQWDEGAYSCTLMSCMRTVTQPYNPLEWSAEKLSGKNERR